MKSVRLCILVFAFLSIISAACNTYLGLTMSSAPLGEAPSPQPTPHASSFPRGRFSTVSAPAMIEMAIENDGSFRIYVDHDLRDTGTFDVSGAEAIVDSWTCAERGNKPATYDWLYDPEVGLAFQPVATDPCAERRQYLAEQYLPRFLFVMASPLFG